MKEKTIDEMFDEIQQVFIESTNKLAKLPEDDMLRDILLNLSIMRQKQFYDLRASYDKVVQSVKNFHEDVLSRGV